MTPTMIIIVILFTSQLAVVQFKAVKRVGAEQKHMFFWMDWLQLL